MNKNEPLGGNGLLLSGQKVLLWRSGRIYFVDDSFLVDFLHPLLAERIEHSFLSIGLRFFLSSACIM